MTRRRRRQPPQTERRQYNLKPGAVNFQPVTDKVVNQMYQNFGPQSDQGYMLSPGAPIRPVPGITPPTGPRGYEYPVGYNIAQLPRSTENYSFTDLRSLASMYYGIQMCEQVWFDYVTKLELVIEPHEDLMKEDQDESEYADDIQFYKDFFRFPDKDHDLHTWMQMAVRDQLEIDAVAIYVRKDRAGRPYALDLIDGSTIKPLVDDRGRRPQPPYPAYEQFVYGVPACFLTTDDMIYVKETDRIESVYGRSRVEKIILNVNVALRKQTKDLARFTDGNVPSGFIQPSIDVQWSQEEIEAYEIQFNNLMSGSDEMRARIKVLPRGFEYKPTDDPDIHIDLDTYLLNVCASNFGITMSELAFIADINRSSGETQENVVYRRAMGPLMSRYAKLFTMILHRYFNEKRFVVRWKGFEEIEDFTNKAEAYSTLTTAGIISPSRAAHLLNLPVDVDLPSPFLMAKTGPVMLEDLADPEVREALKQALIDGAASADTSATTGGQEPDEGDDSDVPEEDSSVPEDDKSTPEKGQKRASDPEMSLIEAIEQLLRESRESLTRHNPGGVSHDQKTHGDWDHAGYASGHTHGSAKTREKAAKAYADKVGASHKTHGKPSHAKTPAAKKTVAKKTAATKKPKTVDIGAAINSLTKRAASASSRFAKIAKRKISSTWTSAQAHAAMRAKNLFSRMVDELNSHDGGGVSGLASEILSAGATIYGKGSAKYASLEKMLDSIVSRVKSLGIDRVDTSDDDDLMDEEDELEQEEEEEEEADEEIDDPWIDDDEEADDDMVAPLREQISEITRWKRRVVEDMRMARPIRPFATTILSERVVAQVKARLAICQDAEQARLAFEAIRLSGERDEVDLELVRWESAALEDVQAGTTRDFFSPYLSPFAQVAIARGLSLATSQQDVRSVFSRLRASPVLDSGTWQGTNPLIKASMLDYARRGVTELQWIMTGGHGATCEECLRCVGQKVPLGVPFATGAFTPPQHPNCACAVREFFADGSSKMNDNPSVKQGLS